MSDTTNQFIAALKSAGYSATKPRLAVFDALSAHDRLSIAALHKACPAIDRATIYRTVALLEQLGIVQRLQQGWKYQLELSAAYSHHHHHLLCNACGAITEIHENAAIEESIEHIAKQNGYLLLDHQIEIRGICAGCQSIASEVAF